MKINSRFILVPLSTRATVPGCILVFMENIDLAVHSGEHRNRISADFNIEKT
jgi:hypothetical protein